jgi:excisionase family DNA binding protein
MSDNQNRGCKTMSIPEAGALYFGLSRNGSYMAAERGEIPTIRVGRLLRVPVAAMERLLDGVKLKAAA